MPFKYNALLGLGLDNTIPLDGAGKIPSTFLPSYVDDVEEYNNLAAFPATGETGKIYVAIDTGFVYRWSGSVYVQIGITAAAGSTTQVQFNDGGAFGGDSGLTFNKTTDALSAGGFIPTSSTVPANGIYLPAANSVAAATNGTQRLTVDTAAITSTLPVVHPLGAVGTPSITFTGDLNTGFWSPTADALAASTAGSERLRITSAGLVGIGTSNPSAGLCVGLGGTTIPIAGSTTGSALFGNAANPNLYGLVVGATTAGIGYIQAQRADGTATTYDLTLQPNGGNVGIGTTSPDALLTVNGIGAFGDGAVGTPSITNTGDLNTGFWFPAADTIAASTAGSERARIDSSGRLLVGTSSDRGGVASGASHTAIFEKSNTEYAQVILATNQNNTNGAYLTLIKSRGTIANSQAIVSSGDEIGAIAFEGSDGTTSLAAARITAFVDGTPGVGDMPGRLVFFVTADGAASATEAMRITSGGQVFIGTQSVSIGTKLDVVSTTGSAAAFVVSAQGDNSIFCYNKATSGDNSFINFGTEASFATRGTVTYNRAGGVVAYNTTSDYRAKTILGDLENSGSTIDAFKVYRGVMNGATVERPMLIAHEAQEVAPYCVTGVKDTVDDDGNPTYQQMDHQVLVPLLIAEIQQLRARVAALEIA